MLRLAGNVPLDADRGVELHDGGIHRAVEELQAAAVEPEVEVGVAFVGVDAEIVFVGGIEPAGDVLAVVVGFDLVVGVALALGKFAAGDGENADDHAQRYGKRRDVYHKLAAAAAVPHQQVQQSDAAQRDAQRAKQARGVVRNAEHQFAAVVLVGQEDEDKVGESDGAADAQAAQPLGAGGVLQRAHGDCGHHQQRHIEPAAVVAGIESVKHRVERRDKRHGKADEQQPMEEAALVGAHPGQDARHAHEGQIGRHAGPFDGGIREKVGQIGRVLRQKGAGEDGKVLLGAPVEQDVQPIVKAAHAGVVDDLEKAWQSDGHGKPHAQKSLKAEHAEFFPADLPVVAKQADKEVQRHKNDLTHKEEIVDAQAECGSQREHRAAVVFKELIHAPQQQREHRGNVQKMVEEDVVDVEAAEGVQNAGKLGTGGGFGITACPKRGGGGGHGKFQAKQRRQQIGRPALGKQRPQPEKRRAQQVERIALHKAGAQIRRPGIGGEAALGKGGLDHLRHVIGEGLLLAVEIAAVQKKAFINDKERQKEHERCGKALSKAAPEAGALLFCCGEQRGGC